jgi:TrmH RNA methyltransferase
LAIKTSKPDRRNPPKPGSNRLRDKEFTLYGWNACMSFFEKRPQDLLRLLFNKHRTNSLAKVKDHCRTLKLPYRLLETEDLNKVAASVHHEGIVMVVRPMEEKSTYTLLKEGLPKDGIFIALDQIENTHNIGAILRTGAFFGSSGMIISPVDKQALVTSSAARMAEGGLELVPLYECKDIASFLRDAQSQKIFVMGTDPKATQSIYDVSVPFPCIVVLGNEGKGLSSRVKSRCDKLVKIPGAGNMQSLNVSVGAGVILAELSRRNQIAKKKSNKGKKK